MTQATIARRYRRLYREAGGLEGSDWYFDAARTARRLARKYRRPFRSVAAIIAVLSPNVTWAGNVTAAESILRGSGPCPGYGANRRKAERIAAGENPDDVVAGPKVAAFYRSILGDNSQAVVDMWMIRAAGADERTVRAPELRAMRAALTTAAKAEGVATNVLQAVVWTHVRGSAT